MNLEKYNRKNLKIILNSGKVFVGFCDGYFSEEDKHEALIIDTFEKKLVEIKLNEIKSVEILN